MRFLHGSFSRLGATALVTTTAAYLLAGAALAATAPGHQGPSASAGPSSSATSSGVPYDNSVRCPHGCGKEVRVVPPVKVGHTSCNRYVPIFDPWRDYVGGRETNVCLRSAE